jgi:hypothetical protein
VLYTMLINEPIEPCPRTSITHTPSNTHQVGSHALNYSTYKCAKWVPQALLKPSLVPKCDICYLKNEWCYTYSNGILVALSHTYVIYFTGAILKLFHALIKLKDFINYLMLSPIYLSNHIDLSQLSFRFKSHKSWSLTISPYHNISIRLNSWTNPFLIVWIVWLCLYGLFMLCYFLCHSCAKSCVLSREEWKDRILQKGKWHTCPSPILLMH